MTSLLVPVVAFIFGQVSVWLRSNNRDTLVRRAKDSVNLYESVLKLNETNRGLIDPEDARKQAVRDLRAAVGKERNLPLSTRLKIAVSPTLIFFSVGEVVYAGFVAVMVSEIASGSAKSPNTEIEVTAALVMITMAGWVARQMRSIYKDRAAQFREDEA